MNTARYIEENGKELLFYKDDAANIIIQQYFTEDAELKEDDGLILSEGPALSLKVYSKFSTLIGKVECEPGNNNVDMFAKFYFYQRYLNDRDERKRIKKAVLRFFNEQRIFDSVTADEKFYELKKERVS